MYLYVGCSHSCSFASPSNGNSQQHQEHDVGDDVSQETHDGRVPRPVQGCKRKDEIEGVDKRQGKNSRYEVLQHSACRHPHHIRVMLYPHALHYLLAVLVADELKITVII